MSYRIVSIGAFSRHPLRLSDSARAARPGHATTTLVLAGDAAILVDPGLPGQILVPRLVERAGLEARDITHVFLTSFQVETTRGLTAFDDARWLVSETERESAGMPLALMLKRAAEEGDDPELIAELERQVSLLARCQAAEDSIAPRVDLFPLPGVTPGLCGLLLAEQARTVVIAGDAVPTVEHLEQGKVIDGAHDLDKARESLMEAIEVADAIVCGRDNLVLNPTKRPF
ncbi:MAG: MBL fold metallo-hydrolase [Phycisphaerales bacterium]